MSPQLKAALRSFATSFLTALLVLIPVDAVVDGDLSWLQGALLAAGTAALRTVLSALDPNMPLFGLTRKAE
jgi:hypothetical protein